MSASLPVVQDGVPLAEGTARGVLPDEPDRRALGEDRGEGERLGLSPVDHAVGLERAGAAIEDTGELRLGREALWQPQERRVQLDQLLGGEGRVGRRALRLVLGPLVGLAGRLRLAPADELGADPLEALGRVAEHLLGLLGRGFAESGELARPEVANGRMGGDQVGR